MSASSHAAHKSAAAPAPDLVPVRRALVSLSDKTGLAGLARALIAHGVEIISTGGTFRALQSENIPVTDVSSITGFPEIMDGRVKTLHPSVHGGILARRDDPAHRAAMTDNGIAGIDMVVVNLYPFEQTLASGADFATCVENIDIGGPAMIRAAAKNHDFVCVVTDPADYQSAIDALNGHAGQTPLSLRRALAARAFARTATYDAAIAGWMNGQSSDCDSWPARTAIPATLGQSLRYGENPHQNAALYRTADTRPGVAGATQIQGKELSFNNINDTDAAFELVAEFSDPAIAIIKHANPCGVAIGDNLLQAYERALSCDPVSAFGGIIAMNRPLDADTAAAITSLFSEVIIAPSVTDDALPVLAKKDKVRVLVTGTMPDPAQQRPLIRTIAGGLLIQTADTGKIDPASLQVVTKRAPTADELRDMIFAFRVCKHVKSNAVVYAKNSATVGIGAGQMSRVDSCRIAAAKAQDAATAQNLAQSPAIGSVVASDAFFPFADGLLEAAKAGATAIIQPGGSIRDADVIKAADDHGLAMVFTGIRHFRH